MSAEKERRYQEFYKNRFVNPIDQGVGRRTGWVLNKEVRKDSEGFELFEDYWSESGEESVDDFSLHANKEHNGKPYKLSSSIPLMPDFTPSSRGSTDADLLIDGQPRTNSPATKTDKPATNTAQKTNQQQADDDLQPAETDKGTPKADAATPQGGMRDSDITGSIIKGGNSFQLQNSALQKFKTKTRLSFSGDVVIQKRKSQDSSSDDGGSALDSTLKASQSEGEPNTHSSPIEDSSPNVQMPSKSAGQNSVVVEKGGTSGAEKTKRNGVVMAQESGSEMEEKEGTTTKDSETLQQKSAKKTTNRKSTASLKQPATNTKQVLGDTAKPKGRKGRNVPLVEEEIQMSGGMFISLQKSTVGQPDVDVEVVPNGMNGALIDQSLQDADDEDIDIVEDEGHPNSYSLATESKKTSKRASEKLAANKVGHSESKKKTKKAKAKKAKTPKASKDELIVISSDEEALPLTQEATRGTSKGASSEESGPINEKSHRQPRTTKKSEKKKPPTRKETKEKRKKPDKNDKGASSEEGGPSNAKSNRQPSRTSRKSERTVRNKSQRGAKSSSSDRESGAATSSDAETKKERESSRRKVTKKKAEQNSKVVVSSEDAGSTGTDEDQQQRRTSRRKRTAQTMEAIAEKQNDDEGSREPSQEKSESGEDAKAPRVRTRSGRGAKKANSPVKDPDLELHPEETVDTGENDLQALNDNQKEVLSKKPDLAPSTKPRNKRASVHFSTVEVISSEIDIDDKIESGDTQTPRRTSVHFSTVEVISSEMDNDDKIESGETQTLPKSLKPLSNAEDGDDESGRSPKKKFKRTPGVQVSRGRATSRKSIGKAEESKSTQEAEDSNKTQRRSSVRGVGRKRGGKRKLYSGDLPESFLNDPSLSDATAATGSSSMNPADQGNIVEPSSVDESQTQAATVAKSNLPDRGRGRGRGKNNRRSNVASKRTSIATEAPQENKRVEASEPDNVVLDFLANYESGKESESTESESEESPSSAPTETSETGGTSSSKDNTAGLFTTVYPEPTPRSILKDSTRTGARSKNLTLQYFEVPRKKAIIIAPDDAENGRRRTRRNRVRPVEFWRNERPEYQRRKSGGFLLVGIQSPGVSSPEATVQRTSKRTGRKRAIPQTPTNISMHVSPPPGSKLAEHPATIVVNPDTQTEVEVDTLRTAKMNTFVGPSGKDSTPDDPITLCKSITQKAFSSGILTIRPLCEKGMQFVQNDTMVFYICRGKVSVTIHHTTNILQKGDMFFIPQGNLYNIKNLRRDEAKLVFFQHKGH